MGLFGPKKHSKRVGEGSEIAIAARLLEVGYGVAKPLGESTRYDLIIEDGDGKFWRVQCKTAWLSGNKEALIFATSSNHYHYRAKSGRNTNYRRGYLGEADYFAVYSPDLRKAYLVPVSHFGASQAYLHLVPTKANNQYGIKMAEDYEL